MVDDEIGILVRMLHYIVSYAGDIETPIVTYWYHDERFGKIAADERVRGLSDLIYVIKPGSFSETTGQSIALPSTTKGL
jgi:hypothetical protein